MTNARRWSHLGIDEDLLALLPTLPRFDLADVAACRATLAAARNTLPQGVAHRAVPLRGLRGRPDVEVLVVDPSGPARTGEVVWFHSGGFVLGRAADDLVPAHALAVTTGSRVWVVDYRLAPEHPWPAAPDDARATLEHVDAAAGGRPVVVVGHSAGGALAAGLALAARDDGIPLAGQVLVCPALDDRCTSSSMRRLVDVPVWTPRDARLSWRYYLGDAAGSPAAAPARARRLDGVAPAHVTTLHLDPLRDEGLGYARRLASAGVRTVVSHHPGTFHRSYTLPARSSRRIVDECARAVAAMLGP